MKKVLAFIALMLFNSSVFAVPGIISCWTHDGFFAMTPDRMRIDAIHANEINSVDGGWMFIYNDRQYYVTGSTCSVIWGVK